MLINVKEVLWFQSEIVMKPCDLFSIGMIMQTNYDHSLIHWTQLNWQCIERKCRNKTTISISRRIFKIESSLRQKITPFNGYDFHKKQS